MTQNNNIVIYQSEDGKVHLDVVYNEETMWLTQQQMSDLYQTSRTNIVERIKHIYEDGELTEEATCRNNSDRFDWRVIAVLKERYRITTSI